MIHLPNFLSSFVFVAALASQLVITGSLAADEIKPAVSLLLSDVTARCDSDGDTLFSCQLIFDNATKQDLVARSSFHSVCDGLQLVVTNMDGKVIAQQSYTYHQSPYARQREFVLRQGATRETIVFPLSEFGVVGQQVKVRLVGFLPECEYGYLLSTETKVIKLQGEKKAEYESGQ